MWDQFSGLVWPFAFLIFAVFAFGMVRRLGASTGARPEPSYDAQPALVSRAELAAFNTLRDAIGTSAHICPKVRIADVLKVRRTGNARADLIAFNRIAQKHVDFVLTDAAGVILYCAELATQIALDAIQLLGGNGYINEFPAGRLLRDAKLYEIGAGTSEIRRMLIGRELFEETR